MATLRDLERLALALPSTSGSLTPTIAFSVDGKPKPKGFASRRRARTPGS